MNVSKHEQQMKVSMYRKWIHNKLNTEKWNICYVMSFDCRRSWIDKMSEK